MGEGKTFKCPECGKEFSQEQSLMQHRKDVHTTQAAPKKPFRIGKLLPYIIGVLILAGIGYVIYWTLSGLSTGGGQIGSFNLTSSFVPYRGNTSAKINVIEFGDFQCSACGAFFNQLEPQIMQNDVNTGKVKFYFMDRLVIGPDSLTLGEGSWCANDQNLYYQYYDYIYANQGQENSGWGSANNLKSLASNIHGLNTTQFNSCLDSGVYAQRVHQLDQLGQNSYVTSTPTFFVGNDQIGYITVTLYSNLQQTIDSQLAKV